MNINELEEKLADYGSGGFQMLEAYILQLLRIEIESEGKSLNINSQRTRPFDAVAPQGIGQIPGPLLIEIRLSASLDYLSRLSFVVKKYKYEPETSLLIILFFLTMSSNPAQSKSA